VFKKENPSQASQKLLNLAPFRTDPFFTRNAIKTGLPIGSGMIESGHKHVLQERLKKAGVAWLPENADAIAQLRVLRSNNQWESLWTLKHAA